MGSTVLLWKVSKIIDQWEIVLSLKMVAKDDEITLGKKKKTAMVECQQHLGESYA